MIGYLLSLGPFRFAHMTDGALMGERRQAPMGERRQCVYECDGHDNSCKGRG